MSILEIQKTLGMLAMPAGLLWLLLAALAVLLLRRRQWIPAALAVLAWGGYGLAGNYDAGTRLLAGLERQVPPPDLRGEPFDAVFVLGGGSELDPSGQPMLGIAGDRIVQAARIWHAGKARILVASGAARDGLAGVRDLGAETRAIWMDLGVPAEAIVVVDRPCWVTRDEIQAYRDLQARRGWRRMGLLTSAWHLPRAGALARRAGLEVSPLGADWRGRPSAFLLHRLVPQGEGFQRMGAACWERLGRAVGR